MVKVRVICYEDAAMEQLPTDGTKKKGLSGLAWAGIGCGAVLIIGVIVVGLLVGYCNRAVADFKDNPERKVAEFVINASSEYETVSHDDNAKTMTIKEKKTGKEMTMSYKDISEGKFAMTDSEGKTLEIGTVKLEDLPKWVPVPAGATVTSGFQSAENGKASGVVVFGTTQTPQEVADFFKTSTDGWSSSTMKSGNLTIGDVQQYNFERSSATQEIHVMSQKTDTGTQSTVTYKEK